MLLVKGLKSQERLRNIVVILLLFFDNFKPRKVSIKHEISESVIFILLNKMQQARITGYFFFKVSY